MSETRSQAARGAGGRSSARRGRDRSQPSPRSTAAERREALVRAAVRAFAHTGLHGTAVSTITRDVGITQPYAFSLFGTKKDLFLAAVEHGFDHVDETFRRAAEAAPEDAELEAMGQAYVGLLADREWLLCQLQAYAACDDDEVRRVVRRRYVALYRTVAELSGADRERLRAFFATGMMLNVAAAMDLPILDEDDAWLDEV
jgi:AcrR family transcriptional regulator